MHLDCIITILYCTKYVQYTELSPAITVKAPATVYF